MVCLIENTCIRINDKTLKNFIKKFELLKKTRFMQRRLFRISDKWGEGRSGKYKSLLSSLKLAIKSLYEINQLAREYDNGQ